MPRSQRKTKGRFQEDVDPKRRRAAVVRTPRPRVVVAVDFGTAYSGFAFAETPDLKDMKSEVFYDWPDQAEAGARPYCKTQTSLRYSVEGGEYHVQDWGWTASIKHKKACTQGPETKSKSYLVKNFKLLLAPSTPNREGTRTPTPSLPVGLTAERVIADYLQLLSTFIMVQLQSIRSLQKEAPLSKRHVQWCLTVPALWDDLAKQQMVKCAEIAGMVQGPRCQDPSASPYPIVTVLEPEAASVYCQAKWKERNSGKGSKFLVVDAGGGTVDLVLHEKMESSGLKIKEASCSTGALCGGAFVDKGLNSFLAGTIGCFTRVGQEFPSVTSRIQEFAEEVKCCFDGDTSSSSCLDVPAILAAEWEKHDIENGTWRGEGQYYQLEITGVDLKKIFDAVVDEILDLIREQQKCVPEIHALMMVGGFSSSPYLKRRIREEFEHTVEHIVNPIEPGSAVCRGALAFAAVDAELMLSRKSKKTYGICVSRDFRMGDPQDFLLEEGGHSYCKNVFGVFVRKGEDVPVDHQVKHVFEVEPHSKVTELEVFATDNPQPEFVTESGVEEVGTWTYRFPVQAQRMDDPPEFEISMFFGRARMEVHVAALNFTGTEKTMSCDFERYLS